jgi:hypothetical protein
MSGFDKDPQFQIIWMPEDEEKEQDVERADTNVIQDNFGDSAVSDREFDSDSVSS